MDPKRIAELDGVRGLAILLVLIWHYAIVIPAEPGSPISYFRTLFLLSWSGVDLFFVLSGFLIGGILIDGRDSPDYFKSFYIRRAFRILPLYFLVLAAYYLLRPANEQAPPLPYLLSFTQNIWQSITGAWNFSLAHTWSLAVEEQFYLALPLLILLVPRRRLFAVVLVAAAFAPAWRLAMLFALPEWQTANYVLLPARMDALLVGVLAALAVRDGAMVVTLRARRGGIYACLAALLMFPLAATVFDWWSYASIPTSTFGFSLLALLYGCLLLVVLIDRDGPVARLARFPPLRRLGILAYCVYLIHPLAIRIATDAYGKTWFAFLLSALAIVLLAELSWRFFESPLLRIGHRWRAKTQVLTCGR